MKLNSLQKIAVEHIMKKLNMDFDELMEKTFNTNINLPTTINDITYTDAITVIEYGNSRMTWWGKIKKENKMIIKHIRIKGKKSKHKGRYIATFVAILNADGKTIDIGWAKCHRLDRRKNELEGMSSKKRGLSIALARAKSGTEKLLPFTLADEMASFLKRMSKYYSDKQVPISLKVEPKKLVEVTIDKKEE